MMEWIDAFDIVPNKGVVDAQGRIHEYEWVTDVPLNGKEDAIQVNFFRYRIIQIDRNGKEKTNYRGSWVTDLPVNEENIELLVKGARSRWKIENECFNTLKNQGYHIEHNFGHG
ncbi:MAG: transposase, partial [Proteobacteria bacterium]|nr:transposase [Pseudomonadota bacterium]